MLRHPSDWKYFMDLFYCCCHLRLFVTNEIITPGSGWGKHYMTSSAVRLWKGLSFLVFDTVDHKHHLWHSGWNLIICSFANGNSWKSETRPAVNLRHKGVFVFSLVHSGEIWSWQIFAWGGSDESAALPSLIRCTDRRTVCVCVCVAELKRPQIGNSCYHEHTFTQPHKYFTDSVMLHESTEKLSAFIGHSHCTGPPFFSASWHEKLINCPLSHDQSFHKGLCESVYSSGSHEAGLLCWSGKVDPSLCVEVIICCHKINRLFLTNIVKMVIYW